MPPDDAKVTSSEDRRHACLGDFDLGEEIAWGSMATIMEATHKRSQKVYAIKVLNKMQLSKKKMIRSALVEKDALVALGLQPHPHPGIARLHYSFHDQHSLYFVLDLGKNGDLKALILQIGSLSLTCTRYYIAQMVDAIQYMHDAGVVHRDIKPENVLLDESWRIKIADFGCAYVNSDVETYRTNTFVGTAAFISPELLSRAKSNPKGPDLWAVGCTIYFLLFGNYPFSAATDYLTMERVKKMDFSIPEGCDSNAADLIRRLLVLNPDDRLGLAPKSSPDELRQHPFFISDKISSEHKDEESEPTTFIDWDSLWTIPAPEILPGPFRRRQKEPWEEDPEKHIWAKFEDIHLIDD